MRKDGTMNQNSNTKSFSTLIVVLFLSMIVKLAWVGVEYLYLPEKGINLTSGNAKSSLHYRYRFASNVALAEIKKPVVKKPTISAPSIRSLKLVGIYSGKNNSVITILKGTKSYIISTGEDVDGFILKDASAREAYFEKAGKEYTLKLFEGKRKSNSSNLPSTNKKPQADIEKPSNKKMDITDKDGIRAIPRSLIKDYTSDIDKIMKDIGVRPINKNGSMQGYKVRFIRKGSPFSELGLKRGDVIKAINGEDIIDLAGPMNMLKSADSIDGLSLTIIRGTEEKELEYEVK